jgi:hypothetical protein
VRAGGPQYPLSDLVDQAGFLGHWNELGGQDHAALGMPPAQQCLAATDDATLKIHDRLVMQLEFALCQCRAQRNLQRMPRLQPAIHLRLEETMGRPAFTLRRIQRQVCMP